MEADSTKVEPLQPPQIHISSSLSGSSVPIRAPLTIDSDSESCLSINDNIYSRTSSFNSITSSIDVGIYSDEHISVHEEKSDGFLAHPGEEFVIESSNVEEYTFRRSFVKYSDENNMKESSNFDESTIFRPFVKYSDGNYVKESSSFDKSTILRPSGKYPDGNHVKESGSFDECFRPFVKYPYGNYVKENSNLDKSTIFRPSVIYPYGNLAKESSSFDESAIFRPSVKYPDENNVKESSSLDESAIFRPFVKYPDEYNVKENSNLDKSTIFRPSVKPPREESSNAIKLGVPVAPLTSDCDCGSDIDSVDGCRWSDSGSVPADEIVQTGSITPKVRIFASDDGLQVEGLFSGDEMNSVLAESIEDEGCKVDCSVEVDKLSELDELSFDLERIGAEIISNSNNDIETETVDVKLTESDVLSIYETEIENINVKRSESDQLSSNSEIIGAKIVSDTNNEIEIETTDMKIAELDKLSFGSERISAQIFPGSNNETEIETVDVKLSESDKLSFNSESIDAEIYSNSNSKIEIETIDVKLPESDELSFNLERIDNENDPQTIDLKLSESNESSFCSEITDAQIVPDSNNEIEIDTEYVSNLNSEIEIETNYVKLSKSDESSFCSERIDSQIVPDSNNKIEIETTSKLEQEVVFDCYRNESKKTHIKKEEMQPIRAKFLSLVRLLGLSNEFDFHLTVLVIGKTGVGKSATINSIFGENKVPTNAFDSETTTVEEITGLLDGIHLKIIDTPGLKCASSDRSYNQRILKSIKKFTQKHNPDVVLYVDRLDTYSEKVNDSQVLRLITSSLGSSVWCNCVIALTHATSNPPDESSGGFVLQRCRFIQEQIVKFGGSNRANLIWVVENHLGHKNDSIDYLDVGFEGLVCSDGLNEDTCDKVSSIEQSSESRDVVKAYYEDYGCRVKILGNGFWSFGFRFYC